MPWRLLTPANLGAVIIAHVVLFCSLRANSEIIDISSLEQINSRYEELSSNYSPKDILLIIGVKKVIFKSLLPPIDQLSENDLSKLDKVLKSFKSPRDTYFDTILFTEYKNELLDPKLPKFILNILNKGSKIIAFDNGLTGNFNNIKNLEIWKAEYLKKFNIDLSSSFPKHNYLIFNDMQPFDNNYPTFYQGILSSNNTPSFHLILNLLITVKFMPKVLIMVDSDLSQLSAMENHLKNYDDNVVFIGYHSNLSKQEESIFNKHDFIKLLTDITVKVNAVKRSNMNIKK